MRTVPGGSTPALAHAWIRDLDELDAIAGRWDALAGTSAMPTQRFPWVRSSLSAFGGRPAILAVFRGDELVGAAPLVASAAGGALQLLGVEELFEPSDFLAADEEALEALAVTLADAGTCLYLQRVPSGSPTPDALRRAYRGRGLVTSRPGPAFPYIPLDDRALEPESLLASRRRSDVRRARRRAEALGPVRHELLAPRRGGVPAVLTRVMAIEAAGWKGRAESALVHDPARAAFFRHWALGAAARGTLRAGFLRAGDEVLAAELGCECAGSLWLFKIGYDERAARCSPGTLLLLETIREAARRGLESVELLGEVEPWTVPWTGLAHDAVSVRVFPASLQGGAHLARTVGHTVGERLRREPLAGAGGRAVNVGGRPASAGRLRWAR
jgi:CelD/BcsL family acetyltransferase involved in cellulose biosynthesis